MSVVILIKPIDTQTKNGTPARVTGIGMMGGDLFRGEIEYEPGKFRAARWRLNGMVRDAPPDWDIVLKSPELQGLYEVAERLGAQMI